MGCLWPEQGALRNGHRWTLQNVVYAHMSGVACLFMANSATKLVPPLRKARAGSACWRSLRVGSPFRLPSLAQRLRAAGPKSV